MSRSELARRVRAAAESEGSTSGCNEKQVRLWEGGQTIPRSEHVRWLAAALGMPVDVLAAYASEGKVGPVEPPDADYILGLHTTRDTLISLEVVHGGTDVASLANRYVVDLRRRLAIAPNPPSLSRDLMAAAGELVGTAAWMSHDADDREAARLLSCEALYLSRLAGDSSTEVHTLTNLALFNLYTGRPQEAVAIVRAALETPLTNYQRTVFHTRESRALAQLGAGEVSFNIAHSALNDFLGGPAPTASEWWWLNEYEMQYHLAMTYESAGRYDLALPIWQSVVDVPAPKWQGNAWAGLRYLRYVRLFRTALEVGDWETAEIAIDRILPFIGGVRSGRVECWLAEAIQLAKGLEVPPSLRVAEQQLSSVFDSV